MTASSAVSYKVVDAGARRVVTVSPARRRELGSPVAHPARPVAPGRVGSVASCSVSRPAAPSPWLAVKVAVVGALVVAGSVVSAAQFVSNAQPDPATQYVAGDPAWAHVTAP